MMQTIRTMLKGAAMGIAEVIPGVSGGTIAFITGIYERLLNAIRAINPSLIKVYKQDGLKAAFHNIDGLFLLKLIGGMVIGFVVGLKLIVSLLDTHPIHIWSFFFGLILASIPIVGKQVKKWGGVEIALMVVGAALVYWVTVAAPSQGSESLILVFISGVVGISALMLPGLSGSFVLLLMGMYTIIMPAIEEFLHNPFGPETTVLVVFGLGLLVGLFSFARVLTYTFKKYPNKTLALLTGFLIGSLNKVWPWQKVLETRVSSSGKTAVKFSESVSPNTLSELDTNFLYGTDPHLWQAILVMIVAALAVLALDRYSPKAI